MHGHDERQPVHCCELRRLLIRDRQQAAEVRRRLPLRVAGALVAHLRPQPKSGTEAAKRNSRTARNFPSKQMQAARRKAVAADLKQVEELRLMPPTNGCEQRKARAQKMEPPHTEGVGTQRLKNRRNTLLSLKARTATPLQWSIFLTRRSNPTQYTTY